MYLSTEKSFSGRTRLCFHTTTDIVTSTELLKKYEELLSEKGFASPYKGLLVNLKYVHMVLSDKIILYNKEELPLSRNSYRDFLSKYAQMYTL